MTCAAMQQMQIAAKVRLDLAFATGLANYRTPNLLRSLGTRPKNAKPIAFIRTRPKNVKARVLVCRRDSLGALYLPSGVSERRYSEC